MLWSRINKKIIFGKKVNLYRLGYKEANFCSLNPYVEILFYAKHALNFKLKLTVQLKYLFYSKWLSYRYFFVDDDYFITNLQTMTLNPYVKKEEMNVSIACHWYKVDNFNKKSLLVIHSKR